MSLKNLLISVLAAWSLVGAVSAAPAADYDPAKTAILLIDPYNDFLSQGGKAYFLGESTIKSANLIENLKNLVTAARAAGAKVVYVPHAHYEPGVYDQYPFLNPTQSSIARFAVFEKGSWGAEYHPDLKKQPGDLEAQYHRLASGFAGTDLQALLVGAGIERVVVAGMRGPTCIASTAYYAVELGYHTTLLSDGIAAFGQEEVDAVVNVSFPTYGHKIMRTEALIAALTAN
ncbi:MAG: cysteine hydrolase [Alphaproteobacteria bacterium]|nr:cysteine hydrolase [Alphaproteobacteria bacterium]